MKGPPDPYRAWLRGRLSEELGVREADLAIQGAVVRRGWPAVRVLGQRDVVAVLQDVYLRLRESVGDARADKWLEVTTLDLARYAETLPAPAAAPSAVPTPSPRPVTWGRRAHDLPLLLARAHAEIAERSLGAIRTSPDLTALEHAAEWDVQATRAEVRRWETEDLLSRLRAGHARLEVADSVAAAAAQGEVLRLTVAELEDAQRGGQKVAAALAHNRLMRSQNDAFLEAFTPLVSLDDADRPVAAPAADLDAAAVAPGTGLHPNVLRARHALHYAQWQSGEDAPAVTQALHDLHVAEHDAATQLQATLDTARRHLAQARELDAQRRDLEARLARLGLGADPLSAARLRLEWRQVRAALRVQVHRYEEAARFLEGLVSAS